MPITVGALKKDRRTTSATYGSEEVNLTYKPSAWTPETEDMLREVMLDDRATSEPTLQSFCDLIIDWDVTNDDGTPYELTVDNLRKLPSAFITICTRAVMEDMLPGEAQRSSGGGSRRRG